MNSVGIVTDMLSEQRIESDNFLSLFTLYYTRGKKWYFWVVIVVDTFEQNRGVLCAPLFTFNVLPWTVPKTVSNVWCRSFGRSTTSTCFV